MNPIITEFKVKKTKSFKKTLCKILLITVGLIILLFVLFNRSYRVSRKNSHFPLDSSVDVYKATKEELIEMSFVTYTEIFGEVKNARRAAKVAAEVAKDIYGQEERPYIVKFNKNANAWIVDGSLPFRFFMAGGVATVAIEKDTGEILMVIHTK